jgi:hypothetical protein
MEETFIATPDIVDEYLGGVTYPASRADLIKMARENGAPQEVITTLEAVEQEYFQDQHEVDETISELR